MPHIHELYDFVVTVFIVHDGRVLLVNHPKYGLWIPMGGHIELDEDVETALYREVQEETGLTVNVLSSKPDFESPGTIFQLTPNYVDVHDANAPHKHIAFIYFAEAENDEYKLSKEHTDMRWLSLQDLEKPEYNLSESIKFYCREAIKVSENNQLLD